MQGLVWRGVWLGCGVQLEKRSDWFSLPVDEGPLGVHQVELVVQPGPGLGNGRGVGEHTDRSLDLGQVTTRHRGGGLVVDTNLQWGDNRVFQWVICIFVRMVVETRPMADTNPVVQLQCE